jgi:anti-sigma factor RsiW
MERERQEEMISAYLDGELAPDERAQVEQWLGDSADLRQFRDDLLSLRASLRRLPTHKAARDFSASIQQGAITGTQDNAGAEDARIEPVSLRSLWAQGAGWRRLAWPAIAIAAALLIMLFDSTREEPRQVAHAPQGEMAIKQQPAAPQQKRDQALDREQLGQAGENDSFAPQSADLAVRQTARPAAIPGETPVPAAGAAADMPQPPSDAPASARSFGKARQDAAQQPDTIVFEVPPDYFSARSFEKLLERRKLHWNRVPLDAIAEKRKSAVSAQSVEGVGIQGQTYAIEASEAELSSLMNDLRLAAGVQQLQAASSLERDELSKSANRPGQSGQQARRVLLRVVPQQSGGPAAPPASP